MKIQCCAEDPVISQPYTCLLVALKLFAADILKFGNTNTFLSCCTVDDYMYVRVVSCEAVELI